MIIILCLLAKKIVYYVIRQYMACVTRSKQHTQRITGPVSVQYKLINNLCPLSLFLSRCL